MKSSLALLLTLFAVHFSFAQCESFPASIPAGNCGDYNPLFSGAQVSGQNTFGVCPSSSGIQQYSNLNLTGGTIRVCGNASLTGMFKQGNIVVECGATAYFPAGLLLEKNCKLVNYGTVIVTGNLVLEQTNNAIFNETTRSRIFVDGSINFGQTQAQTGYLRNRGYIRVDNTLDALDGGFVCLGDSSVIVARNMRYLLNCGGPNFRFSYENAVGNARLYVENTIVMRGVLTASSNIRVLRGTGSSTNLGGCGSFGLATVVNNALQPAEPAANSNGCFNCYTFLPVELTEFVALAIDGDSEIRWTTASESQNDFFTLYHSTDGTDWTLVAQIEGAGDSQTEISYEHIHRQARPGINYYRLAQTDFNGSTTQKGIVAVQHKSNGFRVYPNPSSSGKFTLATDEQVLECALSDGAGRRLQVQSDKTDAGIYIQIDQPGYFLLHVQFEDRVETIPLIVGQ